MPITGNAFFHENEEKTEKINQTFIINSPSGYIIPRDKPGAPPKYSKLAIHNAETRWIKAVYFYNGEYWGIMSASHGHETALWVLMDELLAIYESEDFEKENKDSIYKYSSDFDVSSIEKLVLWEWPGSDREKVVIEEENLLTYIKIENAYKDSEGREWGKTTLRWGWICLSDPENNTEIPSFNPALKPVKWSHDGNRDWTKEATIWPPAEPPLFQAKPIQTTVFMIILAVVFAISAAIGLILLRSKMKKSKERQQDNTRSTE